TGRVRVAAATGFRAGFLSDLFFGRFERGFHIIHPSFRALRLRSGQAPSRNLSILNLTARDVSTSLAITRRKPERGFNVNKISFHPWRASSISRTAKTSPHSAPAVPVHRRLS